MILLSRMQGIVLLTTMMMIAILTMLVLSLMQGVFLYIKSCNQIVTNHDVIYQMEAIAGKLELSTSACIVRNKNVNQLVEQLAENGGCLFDEGARQYKYVLADLGLYPCLQINLDETLYGSHHWLITIKTVQPPNMIVQLRFATIAKATVCELSTVHRIKPGVLSWRKMTIWKQKAFSHR